VASIVDIVVVHYNGRREDYPDRYNHCCGELILCGRRLGGLSCNWRRKVQGIGGRRLGLHILNILFFLVVNY
jgi:hypothetical protein